MTAVRRQSGLDVRATVDEAQELLAAGRALDAGDRLRAALAVTRDPEVLERMATLAAAGARSSRDGIAAALVWVPLVHGIGQRLLAAKRLRAGKTPVVWEEADELSVAGDVELHAESLVLSSHAGRRWTIRYDDIVRARLGRRDELLNGHGTLVLEGRETSARISVRSSAELTALVELLA